MSSFFLTGPKDEGWQERICSLPKRAEEQLAVYQTKSHFLAVCFPPEETPPPKELAEHWGVNFSYYKDSEFSVSSDYLGRRPVYFCLEDQTIASDVFTLRRFSKSKNFEIDEAFLSNCIKWGYDATGRTAFKQIKRLAPNHTLQILNSYEYVLKPQGDLRIDYTSEKPIMSTILSNIERAINLEGANALLLSGGLDSSIIYYYLGRSEQRVRTFSFENGESEYLPAAVEMLELPQVSLEEALTVMQGPIDLGSLLPQVQVGKKLSSMGFFNILTGDGADELFGGYKRSNLYDSQSSDIFSELSYYHFPRLDRVERTYGLKFLSPYVSLDLVALALALPYERRRNKGILKSGFRELLPEKILTRSKKPLKTEAVISGGQEYRTNLVNLFKEILNEL